MQFKAAVLVASALAFVPSVSLATSLPDLCADVYLDPTGAPLQDADGTTLSRYCEWTGPDAPVWAGAVCCSFGTSSAGVSCTAPHETRGTCQWGKLKLWCDYGEADGDGAVTCYQPFESACDDGHCIAPPPGTPQEGSTPLCCFAGGCYELDFEESCGGDFQWCSSPYTSGDGTIGCSD